LSDGIAKGKITKDSVIFEPTSGNTGIGLGFSWRLSYGLRIVLTMPETMSVEPTCAAQGLRWQKLCLPDGAAGMQGAVDKANELCCKDTTHSFIQDKFDNPVKSRKHNFKTTGP